MDSFWTRLGQSSLVLISATLWHAIQLSDTAWNHLNTREATIDPRDYEFDVIPLPRGYPPPYLTNKRESIPVLFNISGTSILGAFAAASTLVLEINSVSISETLDNPGQDLKGKVVSDARFRCYRVPCLSRRYRPV